MRKQVEILKRQKLFKWADLIIYGIVLISVVLLFAIFFKGKSASSRFTGVDAFYDENLIFGYRFDADELYIAAGWENRIIVERESDVLRVRFLFGDEFNLLEIDRGKICAKMKEANCSYHKECVKSFPSIDSADGFTVCVPHKLIVRGTGVPKGVVQV